jgi:hypothetical protein
MKSKQIFTRKLLAIALILSTCLFTTTARTPLALAAGDGTVDSIVKITSNTLNGPVLSDVDTFGDSVANIGDLNDDGVNDLAIGAIYDDAGGTNRGAVHILFMNTDGSVDSTVEINDTTPNGPVLDDQDVFGYSLTVIDDLNDDGVVDLAVGARGDDGNSGNEGAVHILFMNTDGSVDSTVEINGSTPNGPTLADSDFFGSSIENIGDLNGDDVIDLAVGAQGDNGGSGGFDRGAVHILFMNTDGSVDSTVEINDTTPNGPVLNDADDFAKDIANIGDLNGDDVIDLAVSAANDDNTGFDNGTVHIMFMNTNGSVDSTVEINGLVDNAPVMSNYENFGTGVTGIGDLNDDGVIDIAVGAANVGDDYFGAAYILFMNTDGSVDSYVEINDATDNGPALAEEDYFGSSIANIGDLNGDGTNDIAIGANGDDTGGADKGAVYILFMHGDNPPAGGGGGRTLRLDDPKAPNISVSDITESSAKARLSFSANGIITNEVGITLSNNEDEVIYSKSWNVSSPSQMGAVNTISDLSCNTTYTLLAHAKNSESTTYSEPLNFTTASCEDGTSVEPPAQITPTPTAPETPLPSPTPAPVLFPVRDLYYGLVGQDVEMLQRFLNSSGFKLAQSGPGSPGQETNLFGSLTRSALAKIQAAHSIFPTAGYFGPITRSVLKNINFPGIWW